MKTEHMKNQPAPLGHPSHALAAVPEDFQPMTQRQVAAMLGMTHQNVSRIEKRALRKIRDEIEKQLCGIKEMA